MNTEFKVKLTPKDDKAVYGQKSTNSDPPERRPNCRIGSKTQIWNYHSTAVLQVSKPHICTKEGQRKIASPCESTEIQQSHCG